MPQSKRRRKLILYAPETAVLPRVRKKASAPIRVLSLRLYLSPGSPASERALANLRTLCTRHFGDAWDLEVVDVMESPQRTLFDGIMITPTLLKLSPAPFSMITGDLTQTRKLLEFLRTPSFA